MVSVAQRFGKNLARARERAERVCRVDTLIKLAGALGVKPGELLDGLEWEPGGTRLGRFEFPDRDATL